MQLDLLIVPGQCSGLGQFLTRQRRNSLTVRLMRCDGLREKQLARLYPPGQFPNRHPGT